MDPSRREEWQGGPGPAEHGDEHAQSRQTGQVPYGSAPLTQPQPSTGGLTLPPPASIYGPGASLPPLGGMHTSPSGPSHQPQEPPQEQQPPRPSLSGAPLQQGGSHSLPGIHQAGQPMNPQAEYLRERERDREMQDIRDRDIRREWEDRGRQEAYEREQRDFEMRARQDRDREQLPQHQGHADSGQLHAPVAVPPPGSTPVHGPNGLLASAAGPQGNPPQYTMPAPQPTGSPNSQVPLFAPQQETTPHTGQRPPQVPDGMAAFRSELRHDLAHMQSQGPSEAPGSGGAPGQQPILNDALSYLDQVKVQFHGQSDVYNHFLDIMKDFKSQAIDTPGVIRRVSQLFAGNSTLIQGFNTFLPAGYRIECNADGNPDGIRVLTPQGTFINTFGQELESASGRRPGDPPDPAAPYEDQNRGAGGQMDGAYFGSPSLRPEEAQPRHRHLSPFEGSAQRENHHSGVNAALLAHQQEQRGVAQLQNAASASDQGAMPMQQSVSPSLQATAALPNGLLGGQRGPVEFNHAISYVNKIKNRFTGQPEIYKNFLEILQTYQRESRPIQDVYSQVTTLFAEAPDLLRDFKQFLPDTTGQTKTEGARPTADELQTSNVRGGLGDQLPRHTPKPEQQRLPPVGNFQPTPTANRDGKRKRGGDRGGPVAPPNFDGPPRGNYAPGKRAKQSQAQQQPPPKQQQQQQTQADAAAVEPTLIPALPHPMDPATTTSATAEELTFFDKVKKHLGNKSTMSDWLKLCNLYSQDLIDLNTLVSRAYEFIGDNVDLYNWFKAFTNYSPENRTIENRARPDSGRVSLNNCRGYGPSYRLLPKRDRQSICSGRDELCNAVLNDAWASHPTWASEDSGFIAHRKNVHEEGLHRIEEERHDYDHHILVCERGIQILEPIAQQIANTPQEALHQMRLDPDFAVTNHFVFKTSLSKIYGREHAASIINSLPERPAPIVPVMLLRMRQKLEEWKMVQREWEKVWRDQTQKMFWRSLDHQNVQLKNQDKRQFQSKTLQNEIAVKFAEQQKAREKSAGVVPYQMKFVFTDKDVLFDVSYLLLTYTEHMFNSESPKLQAFIKDFVPLFFDIDSEAFSRRMQEVNESSKPNDEMEEDTPASETSNQSRARKSNGKKGDLLRDVLDKSRKPTRGDRESSVASGSRASTPDVATTAEEDAAEAKEAAEEEVKHKTWFNHPVEGNLHQKRNVRPNEAFKRNIFNLYGNLNIYCFFRVFVLLYERLLALKQSEKEVAETVRKEKMHKPAEDFGIIDRKPQDFWRDVGPSTNYYQQILDMLEEVAKNNDQISMGQVEEVLRRYYLSRGYLLYTYEKMMSALTRFVIAVYSNDAKDRSNDIMTLFFKDRKKEMTTHQDEVTFRKQVEKYVKEGDIYRIAYNHNSSTATVRLMRREENTFDLHGPDYAHVHGTVTPEDRWRLYVTLYSSLEPTEGIARAELRRTFTKRTLRLAQKHLEQIVEKLKERKPEGAEDIPNRSLLEWRELLLFSREELQLRVSPTTYAIIWGDDSGEEEWTSKPFLSSLAKESSSSDAAGQIDQEGGTKEGEQHHEDDAEAAFLEKFVMNNSWMAGRKREEVDEMNREFREWVGDGNSNGGKKEEDVVMVE